MACFCAFSMFLCSKLLPMSLASPLQKGNLLRWLSSWHFAEADRLEMSPDESEGGG